MIGVTTAIIANDGANIRRNSIEITDQLLDGFLFQLGFAGDGFVKIRYVSTVMFPVMDFHRLRVDVRFQRIFGIWKWR